MRPSVLSCAGHEGVKQSDIRANRSFSRGVIVRAVAKAHPGAARCHEPDAQRVGTGPLFRGQGLRGLF